MGIQGLLPQLKPIQNPVTLQRYSGKTLAIDGYAWLHKSACSCAFELAMGKPTEKYLKYFIKKFHLLKSNGIEPYLVFDGDSIPVKKETELKRREKRVENKEIAHRLWESGEKRNAMDYFQKCVDITPEMAKCVIDYCKINNIKYVVAPFEADSQMVYLEQHGIVDGIISEDSDLLIFGCQTLITKLNDFGECIEICKKDFCKLPRKFPLGELTDEEIKIMVCLSGCDYTNGIPKIGLVTAMKLVKNHRKMERIILHIQREGKFKIPDKFLEEFKFATFAFKYQRVYCPLRKCITTLNDIPVELNNNYSSNSMIYSCIGHVIHRDTKLKTIINNDIEIDHNLHTRIALGELNPYDCNKPLVNREHKLQLISKSITSSSILESRLTSNNSNVVKSSHKKIVVSKVKSIDSFFQKSGIKNIIDRDDISNKAILISKTQDNRVDKIGETIKRRKLCNRNAVTDCESATKSKFFVQTNRKENVNQEFIDLQHNKNATSSDIESPLPFQVKEEFNNTKDSIDLTQNDSLLSTQTEIEQQGDSIGFSVSQNSNDHNSMNLIQPKARASQDKGNNNNNSNHSANNTHSDKEGSTTSTQDTFIPFSEQLTEISSSINLNMESTPQMGAADVRKVEYSDDDNIPEVISDIEEVKFDDYRDVSNESIDVEMIDNKEEVYSNVENNHTIFQDKGVSISKKQSDDSLASMTILERFKYNDHNNNKLVEGKRIPLIESDINSNSTSNSQSNGKVVYIKPDKKTLNIKDNSDYRTNRVSLRSNTISSYPIRKKYTNSTIVRSSTNIIVNNKDTHSKRSNSSVLLSQFMYKSK